MPPRNQVFQRQKLTPSVEVNNMTRLAVILSRQGKLEEAEAILRQVLALRTTQLGTNDKDTRMQPQEFFLTPMG